MIESLRRRRWTVAVFCFSLAAHFAGYLAYPSGLGGDAARLGIHTLDFLQRGVWPFYIYHIYAPNPLIIYLQAPLFAAFGFSPAVLRGLTAFAGALASPLAYITCRELLGDGDPQVAHHAGLLAALGLGLSPFFQVFSRTGTEHMLLPPLALLAAACLWRGLAHGRRTDFVLAGLVLGLSQYSYIVARGFAAALAIACLVAVLVDPRLRARWRGLMLAAFTALAVMLPQILFFISAPPTFFARTGQSAGQFVFGLPDPVRVFGLKLLNQFAALGWGWDTGYHPFSGRPLLNPVLFAGLLIAIILAFRLRRASHLFGVSLTALMLVPDLITYEGLSPSATRISSAVPFIFILAGAGCAAAWTWLERSRPRLGWLVPAAVLMALVEGQWDFHRRVIPTALASDGLEWKASLIEIAEADYINAHVDQAILIPSSEYQRAPLTFLLAARFPDRAGATVPPLDLWEAVTVIQPLDPDRPTVDGPPSGYIPIQWVLLKNGTAYFLPPLDAIPNPPVDGILNLGSEEQVLYTSNGAPAARVSSALWLGRPPAIQPVSVSFVNGIDLVGFHAAPLSPGQPIIVSLYWQRRAELFTDVQVFVQILDRNGEPIAAIHDWPLHGAYRAVAWRIGETVPLSYTLNIPAGAPPGPYRLVAGVYDVLRQQRVPLSTGEDVAPVAALKIPLPPAEAHPAQPAPADFGPAIHLDGYTWSAAPPEGGMRLDLFWRATAAPDFDYTAFVHVVDSDGNIVAQSDSQPLDGQYPTSIWAPGETILDPRVLSIPPGTYQLFVGVYRWDTGERLPARVDGKRVLEDRVLLGEVRAP